jgi:NAD(P)-dependent dehydrogenase (short-subunit alcohol dehydrogenase family)
MDDKKNKRPTCVVTGGSSGIGLATAKTFARRGYNIAFCGRNVEKLSAASDQILKSFEGEDESIETLSVEIDLTDVDQAKSFTPIVLERFGRIDVLVNNASMAPLSNFEEIDAETFEATINIAIRSLFYLTQDVWKQMKAQGAGTVVNISSLSAVDPFPGFSLYGACKAWLDLMTHALAGEGSESGLRVCSVRPGAVETPMLRGLFPDFPAQQCVQPEDIADVVWGCVSDPEKYPSGQAFPVTKQET